MGGYAPPPEDDAPKTAAEADAGNVVGRENRARVGLSGYGGRSESQLQAEDRKKEARAAAAEQSRIDRERAAERKAQSSGRDYSGRAAASPEVEEHNAASEGYTVSADGIIHDLADYASNTAQNRPGWADPSNLGDSRTRELLLEHIKKYPDLSESQLIGHVLEEQRIEALSTPGTRDERYYENERDKWAQNMVEKSAQYHYLARESGHPTDANPFEYQGDLAVEFLKGEPRKSSEVFSPTSGTMASVLPGGLGTQESEWNTALAKYDKDNKTGFMKYPGWEETPNAIIRREQPADVSYLRAVEVLGAAEGHYGPYGSLLGGKADTHSIFDPTPLHAEVEARVASPSPFDRGFAIVPITKDNVMGTGPGPDAQQPGSKKEQDLFDAFRNIRSSIPVNPVFDFFAESSVVIEQISPMFTRGVSGIPQASANIAFGKYLDENSGKSYSGAIAHAQFHETGFWSPEQTIVGNPETNELYGVTRGGYGFTTATLPPNVPKGSAIALAHTHPEPLPFMNALGLYSPVASKGDLSSDSYDENTVITRNAILTYGKNIQSVSPSDIEAYKRSEPQGMFNASAQAQSEFFSKTGVQSKISTTYSPLNPTAVALTGGEQKPPSNITTKIIPPTGEVDFFGNKIVVPGLAFFQQPTIITTDNTPKEVPSFMAMMAGSDDFSFKMVPMDKLNEYDSYPWIKSKGSTITGGTPEMPILESHIKSQQSAIAKEESALLSVGKTYIDDEGYWTGTPESMAEYNRRVSLLGLSITDVNEDVKKYNQLSKDNPMYETKYDISKTLVVTSTATQGSSMFETTVASPVMSVIKTVIPDYTEVLDIPYRAGFAISHPEARVSIIDVVANNGQVPARPQPEWLPSDTMKIYFTEPGKSYTKDGQQYTYTGSRPYLDFSTPLNEVQKVAMNIRGGNEQVNIGNMNPLYLQTDKDMLAQQQEIKSNPNIMFSEVLPLKMDVSSMVQGLWNLPREDPVMAAVYYATPMGIGAAENALAWASLRSGTVAAVAQNPITRNMVSIGVDSMMAYMITESVLRVPGYSLDPIGAVTSGKPIVGRTIEGYDTKGQPIYASQMPQATGRRAGQTAGEWGLLYAGSVTAGQIAWKSVHQTPQLSPTFMDRVHGKAANIFDVAFDTGQWYNARGILRETVRSTDMGMPRMEVPTENAPRPLDPGTMIQNRNARGVMTGIQEATGVPASTDPALFSQKLGANFRDKMNAISEVRKTGTRSGDYWNEHVEDIGKNVYQLKGIVNEKQRWLTEEIASGRMTTRRAEPFQRVLDKYNSYIDDVLLQETMTIRRTPHGPLEDVSVRAEYTRYRVDLDLDLYTMRTSGRTPGPAASTHSIREQPLEIKLKGTASTSTQSAEGIMTTPSPVAHDHLIKPFANDVDVQVGRGFGVPEQQARTIAESLTGPYEREAARVMPGFKGSVQANVVYRQTWVEGLTGIRSRGTDPFSGRSLDSPLVQNVNRNLVRWFGEANPEDFGVRFIARGTDMYGSPVQINFGVIPKETLGIDFKISTTLSPPLPGESRVPFWGMVREVPSQAEVPFTGLGTLLFGSPHIVREKAHEYTRVTVTREPTVTPQPMAPPRTPMGPQSPVRASPSPQKISLPTGYGRYPPSATSNTRQAPSPSPTPSSPISSFPSLSLSPSSMPSRSPSPSSVPSSPSSLSTPTAPSPSPSSISSQSSLIMIPSSPPSSISPSSPSFPSSPSYPSSPSSRSYPSSPSSPSSSSYPSSPSSPPSSPPVVGGDVGIPGGPLFDQLFGGRYERSRVYTNPVGADRMKIGRGKAMRGMKPLKIKKFTPKHI